MSRILELLARLGIFRLMIALKAFSSLITGYFASKIRSHSKCVNNPAKFGEDKHIDIQGYSMHYTEAGEGPPLLLIPGTFTTYRSWNRVIPLLTPRFRIFAIDYIGAGCSEKPKAGFSYTVDEQADIIARVIEKLSLGPVNLAGLSYGAAIALCIAAKYPHLVKKTVCIEGGAAYPTELPRFMELILRYPFIGDLVIAVLKTNLLNPLIIRVLAGPWYKQMTAEDKAAAKEELFYVTAGAHRLAWHGISSSTKAPVSYLHEETNISGPLLYVYGRSSKYAELLEMNKAFFEARLPGAQVLGFAEGIHYLHLQKPEDIASSITEFVYK